MKVCFITGHQKPEKCGITDYVNLLSDELTKHGHQAKIIEIKSPKDFDYRNKDLPKADLYSLQFAPYLFSPKGLSGRFLFSFGAILKNRLTHINFHEIWVGAYPQASCKEKLWGWSQKREILKFLNILNPNLITATNIAAMDRLKKQGISARYLYLFGNIPRSKDKQFFHSKYIKVVFFGTLYDKFPYEQLGVKLDKISDLTNQPIKLCLIGRQRENNGLKQLIYVARKHGFSVLEKGELPINLISNELQLSDVGISTTPYDVIGKSGTTAAMLEHRLPTLAYDDGDTPQINLIIPKQLKDQIFLINDHSSVEKLLLYIEKPRKSFFDSVAHTANKMLKLVS